MLEAQRRRLYFTLPEAEPGYPHWSMTAFRFAGDYLAAIESLKGKKSVSENTRGRIARGLNRVMTGLLLENADRIFIASSGGFTQSKSEEHTSELQSLMRISYAVFCLKTKIQQIILTSSNE